MRAMSTNVVSKWGVLAGLLFSLFTFSLQAVAADDAESITISIGSMKVVEVPFRIESFRATSDKIVRCESLGKNSLRISALKAGGTDVQITGAGGAVQSYSVTVIDNVGPLYKMISAALDDVPEVDISMNGGKVMLKGDVNSLSHWSLLKKVTDNYSGTIDDYTQLIMPPDRIIVLRKMLESQGFTIAKGHAGTGDKAPNKLSVTGLGDTVSIQGFVYSDNDIETINKIIASQSWLGIKDKDSKESSVGQFSAMVDVSVVSTMLEVDVAFITVSESFMQKVGVNLWEAGLMTLQLGGAVVADATKSGALNKMSGTTDGVSSERRSNTDLSQQTYNNSATYDVASSLAGTLQFITRESPNREIQKSHMTFKNGSPEWQKYLDGGTIYVRVASDNATSLEEIEYGLISKVRGGLADGGNILLDLDLELSAPTQVPGSGDYDLRRKSISTSVTCPIGHTLIVGGGNRLMEGIDMNGTPLLRSVPGLRWFFSQKETTKRETQLLILVSPHIVGAPRVADKPYSSAASSIEETADKDVKERVREKHKRRFFFF